METSWVTTYGIGRKLDVPYDEAVELAKAALREEGFGVLTEIDVRQTLKEKRGREFQPYVILGACNPPLAEQALLAETNIGLLLPCNVIVYETAGGSVVAVQDPVAMFSLVGKPELAAVAGEVRSRLERVLEHLAGAPPTEHPA